MDADLCDNIRLDDPDSPDHLFMREAIALARMAWGRTTPNPMVGAVIVKDGEIIGRGFHYKAGEPHAEINAFSDAERHHRDTEGATLYVTLEPCSSYGRTPPCVDAIIARRIKRVVIACLDPNPNHCGKAVELLEEAGIEVSVGVENADAMELNESFFKWITAKRPFVILKMAMTLDGKIATENGDSKYVTDTPARSRVQTLRRLADAIMVGGDTCRIDHPKLTVREPANWECQPLRLIASRSMEEEELAEYFPDGNAELVRLEENGDWDKLLEELGSRNIVTLLIEGGGELAASALAADAVDYVEFHIAPKLLGGRDSRPVLGGESPEFMSLARKLYKVTTEQYGEDIAVCGYTRE